MKIKNKRENPNKILTEDQVLQSLENLENMDEEYESNFNRRSSSNSNHSEINRVNSQLYHHHNESSDECYEFEHVINGNNSNNSIYDHYRQINKETLAYKLIVLMKKLKDSIKQLCLTPNSVSEVDEQLNEILQEFRFQSQQMGINPLLDLSAISMKDNYQVVEENNYPYNIAHIKCNNTLLPSVNLLFKNEPCSHLYKISMNQKQTYQQFIRKYLEFLTYLLRRIAKYQGQKKLKFLVDSVMKQIFSSIMRLSFEIKLDLHRIYKKNVLNKRDVQIFLFLQTISRIFTNKLYIGDAFNALKRNKQTQINSEDNLVHNIKQKFLFLNCFLQKQYERSKRLKFNIWRKKCHLQKQKEQQNLNENLHAMIEQIIKQFIDNVSDCFKWKFIIWGHMDILLKNISKAKDCIFLPVQENLHKQCQQSQSYRESLYKDRYRDTNKIYNETVQQISYRYSRYSNYSVSSPFSQKNSSTQFENQQSFIEQIHSKFAKSQFQQCLRVGQIRSDSSENSQSLLMIPIRYLNGVVIVRWKRQDQTQKTYYNLNKNIETQSISINGFRNILVAIQRSQSVFNSILKLQQKFLSTNTQIMQKSYYPTLLNEYLSQILNCYANEQKNQKKVSLMYEYEQEKNRKILQFRTNRQQKWNETEETIIKILQKMQIQNVYIYHKDQVQPCISYGNQKPIHLGKDIIESIFMELQNKRNKFDFDMGETLTIKRNQKISYICPLQNTQLQLIGFIQIYFHNRKINQNQQSHLKSQEEQILANLKDFILPLMTKTSGNVSCNYCQYKILSINNQIKSDICNLKQEKKIENSSKFRLNFIQSLRVCSQKNCQELQNFVKSLIKQNIPEQKSFMNFFYKQQATSKLDKNSNFSYYTFVDSKTNLQKKQKQLSWIQFSQIQLSKLLTTDKIIQTYSSAKLLSIINNPKQKTQTQKMVKLLLNSPLFENTKLHLFQMQNTSNVFQLTILPIIKMLEGHRNIIGMIWFGKFLTQDRTQEQHELQISYLMEIKNCINKNSQFLSLISQNNFLQNIQTSLQKQSQSQQNSMINSKCLKQQLSKIFKGNIKMKNLQKNEEQLIKNIQKFIKDELFFREKTVKLLIIKSYKSKFNDSTVDILSSQDKKKISTTEQLKIMRLIEKIQEQTIFAFEPLSSSNLNYDPKVLRKCLLRIKNVQKTSKNIKIVFPCLASKKLQKDFLHKMKLQYLLKGQYMNKQYEILKQITQTIIKKKNDDNQRIQVQKQSQKWNFFSSKFTAPTNNQTYLFVLSFSDIDKQNQSSNKNQKQPFFQLQTQNQNNILEIFQFIKAQFIKNQLFAKLSLQQKIQEKLKHISLLERHKKKQKIQNLQNLLKIKKIQMIKHVISQFQLNGKFCKNSLMKNLSNIISKTFHKEKNLIKQAFNHLFAFNLSKQFLYKKHSNSLIKVVDEIIVIKTKKIIFKYLLTFSIADDEELTLFPEKRVCYQKLKSLKKFKEILQNLIATKKYKVFLQKLNLYVVQKSRLRKISKALSTHKIADMMSKMVKQSQQLFFKQLYQIEVSLFKTLSLVGQECKYIKFMSKKHFINYIQERLNTGIDSSSCHKIKKIQLHLRLCDHSQQQYSQIKSLHDLQFTIQLYKDLNEKNSLNIHKQKFITFLKKLSQKYFIQSFQRYRQLLDIKGKKMGFLLNRIFNIKTLAYRIKSLESQKKVYQIKDLVKFFQILKSESYKKNIQHNKLTIKQIEVKQQTLKNLTQSYQKSLSILNQGQINQNEPKNQLQQKQNNISRKEIKTLRKQLDKLQDKEQSLSIQYQIKSKTLAGYKIMKHLQKVQEKQNLNQFLNSQNKFRQNNESEEYLQIKKNKLIEKNIDFQQKNSVLDDKMKVNSIFQLRRVIKAISKKQLRSSLYRLNSYSCFVSPANTLR